MSKELTAKQVSELLSYDPETGDFTWKESGVKAGSVWEGVGYRIISIDAKSYYAHELVFLLESGEWPESVEHLNCDRADNRRCNLVEGVVA